MWLIDDLFYSLGCLFEEATHSFKLGWLRTQLSWLRIQAQGRKARRWIDRARRPGQDGAGAESPEERARARERLDELTSVFHELSSEDQAHVVQFALHICERRESGRHLPGRAAVAPTRSPEEYQRLTETAYHEAGHAVVAYALGAPFVMLSIRPSERSYGRVRRKFREAGSVGGDELLGTLPLGMAGPAAAALHSALSSGVVDKAEIARRVELGWRNEPALVAAFEAISEVVGPERAARAGERSGRRVLGILADARWWAATEALAAELLATTRVGDVRARRVIETARRAGPHRPRG